MFNTGLSVLRHLGLTLLHQRATGVVALALVLVPAIMIPLSVHSQTLQVLYSFGIGDGPQARNLSSGIPYKRPVLDSSGNLYGTTPFDPYDATGMGTVYKLNPTGKYTVLHSFTGSDGKYPTGGVVRDGSGNLYGTTLNGGAQGLGVVFKLNTTGTVTVLHSFIYKRRGQTNYFWRTILKNS